jgi:RimJ/RimL family protein N-acetyltransferase
LNQLVICRRGHAFEVLWGNKKVGFRPLRLPATLLLKHRQSGDVNQMTETKTERKLGRTVETHAAHLPEPISLAGRYAKLEPLDARHAGGLWSGAQASGLWDYLGEGPSDNAADFEALVRRFAATGDARFYCILDAANGEPAGWASLMRVDVANRVIEVGNILFTPALQRTRAATEAMYLLARYVFEELGYRRYEWKCNALNMASRRAAERYGFIFEGLFRQHRIVKGRNRDTAWFSMLDSEWPERKARFERWLDPANFDAEGRQVKRLEEC